MNRKRIIDFNPEGLQGLHFFMNGFNFPIVIGTYSDWEETQVFYLADNIRNGNWDTEDVCRWCVSHQIKYQIINPIRNQNIIKRPYKYYKYLELNRKIKNNTI